MQLPRPKRSDKRWPEGAIVYQIYPRSFYDSNNDGIGDIPGVTARLNYLKSLGVNVIWLSPFYPSPMADFGYDVADYCDVDPMFGTLNDMDKLIKAAHAHDIRVLVDLVPNHTSDEHEWFRESRKSHDNAYADWYIWKDPKGKDKRGKPIPPNNWLDIFTGETAWEWEPTRQQFYLHSFDVHQPDLNWTNPEVREAIKSAMRFWLDRGVDGFRVDAVRHMGKDPLFKDNPRNPDYHGEHKNRYGSIIHKYSQGAPQLYVYLAEMAAVLREEPYKKRLRFMVTEAWPEGDERIEEYMAYYEGMDPEVAAPFIFEGFYLSWHAGPWHKFLGQFHEVLKSYSPLGVSSYAFGNHDKDRLATHLGEDAARSAAVMLLTLPGMVFIYNGEEIGMVNGKIPPSFVQDPAADGGEGRDPERTPMQWTPDKNAGFSEAETTWLPMADGFEKTNVKTESKDPSSFLTLYRQLGKLRNNSAALKRGDIKLIKTGHDSILGYIRTSGSKSLLVLVNFTNRATTAEIPKDLKLGRRLITSDARSKPKKSKNGWIHLLPNEAAVFDCKLR